MANTFTGLKLQGMIGKFGAKKISDIEGKNNYYSQISNVLVISSHASP